MRGSTTADGENATKQRIESGTSSSSTKNVPPARNSYLSDLALFHGVLDRKHSFLSLMLAPLQMCTSPEVIYGTLNYGLAITLLVIIATGSAQVFATACNFGASAIGYTCELFYRAHPHPSN